ncbi:hypothetical protein U0070_001893 [Myodes glareolus]|uniref:Uncharacterized protein n=1 Tax=Myodes glareolus TaxID=447135 RepID=A0AAW0HNB3_MYOGA
MVFVIKQCDTTGKQEPIAVRSKPPGSPTSSMSADQASSSPLLPLNSGEFSRGDLNHQGDASTSGSSLGSGSKPADAWAKQSTKESASAPFVPFSGGGQRLGGPSGSLRPLTSSTKSPKSFSGPGGPSKPKKSKPGEEPQQEPEPHPCRVRRSRHLWASEEVGEAMAALMQAGDQKCPVLDMGRT